MNHTAGRVLCYGLLTGLLFWCGSRAVGAETATVAPASQGGPPPLVELATYPGPAGIAASPLHSVPLRTHDSLDVI
jgi:hypothetical protein